MEVNPSITATFRAGPNSSSKDNSLCSFFPHLGLYFSVTSTCHRQPFVLPYQLTYYSFFSHFFIEASFLNWYFFHTSVNLQALKNRIASSRNPASSSNEGWRSQHSVTIFTVWPFLLKWNHHSWTKKWMQNAWLLVKPTIPHSHAVPAKAMMIQLHWLCCQKIIKSTNNR